MGRLRRIGLLGTQATVYSRYWERKLAEAFPEMEVLADAAPEFVPLVWYGQWVQPALMRANITGMLPTPYAWSRPWWNVEKA